MSGRAWTLNVRTETGSTRLRVKRCCESCGAEVGDATEGGDGRRDERQADGPRRRRVRVLKQIEASS